MRHAAILIALAFARVAAAEPPGLTARGPYPEPAYRPTEAEQALLDEGYMPSGQAVGGVLVAATVGFGLGQAVEGRYGATGWIWTVADAASWTAFLAGLHGGGICGERVMGCNHAADQATMWGAIGLSLVRIIEVGDALWWPGRHDQNLRDLHRRMGEPLDVRVIPFVAHDADRTTAGLSLRF